MMTDSNLGLTWQMFVNELKGIDVGPITAVRILLQANDVAKLAGVSMAGLPDFGYLQRGMGQRQLACGLGLAVHPAALRQ